MALLFHQPHFPSFMISYMLNIRLHNLLELQHVSGFFLTSDFFSGIHFRICEIFNLFRTFMNLNQFIYQTRKWFEFKLWMIASSVKNSSFSFKSLGSTKQNEFITAIVVNWPKRKLAKRIGVFFCTKQQITCKRLFTLGTAVLLERTFFCDKLTRTPR